MIRVLRSNHQQAGVATIEFALSFMVFWVAFIGVVEFSRLMFAWGTAGEATQIAARLASICDMGAAQEERIRNHVAQLVTASGQVDLSERTDWLQFSYFPSGCAKSTCTQIEVRLHDIPTQLLMPLPAITLKLPEYRTRQPRETMSNSMGNEANDVCI
jgi:hypothetical protein